LLTHPSLLPTFQEEILETLLRQVTNNDFTLPLAYYHTVEPTLKNPEVFGALFAAMAKFSVVEAFYFLRGQPENRRKMLLESLISNVLQGPFKQQAASRSVELVNLPLDTWEEEVFEDYLTSGPGKGFKRAKDTVMMRRIATGKLSQAMSLESTGTRMINGMSWNVIRAGLEHGLGPRLDV
jgi:hypothetical protein